MALSAFELGVSDSEESTKHTKRTMSGEKCANLLIPCPGCKPLTAAEKSSVFFMATDARLLPYLNVGVLFCEISWKVLESFESE